MTSSIESTEPVLEDALLERTFIREMLINDHLAFTRYFFRKKHGHSFIMNWHHRLISDRLQDVIDGRIKNLLINVAPGSSKTEQAVINFIARGLAINPLSRFLHLSYSDDLTLLNSQSARDIVESDEYQSFWPLRISDDTKSKKRWNVEIEGNTAGGVYATSLGGQITGFRAGHMVEGFSGAILVDDPLKPQDSFSRTKLSEANRTLLTTVKSRKAHPDIPIVVIMQRIAEQDPSQFILDGSMGGEWHHLVIPALIDDEYVSSLPEKYRNLVSRESSGRFSYWPYKERTEDLEAMERGEGSNKEGSRMNRYVFASQYQQRPVSPGGNIIKGSWFHRFKEPPRIRYRKIYADTAQKTGERNDFSVFELFGFGEDGKIYLLDLIRGKWEAPDLERNTVDFWNKHKHIGASTDNPMLIQLRREKLGQLRELQVEDKVSGTGLIQKIRTMNHIPVKGIPRTKDKLTRVMDVVGYIESGMICLPESSPWVNDFLQECEAFTADGSHAHDDQIDPLCDAITDMLGTGNVLEKWKKLI